MAAGTGAGAAEDVNVGPAAEEAAAVGSVMVTPALPQNCWANTSVAICVGSQSKVAQDD